jgi:hypothetical protein
MTHTHSKAVLDAAETAGACATGALVGATAGARYGYAGSAAGAAAGCAGLGGASVIYNRNTGPGAPGPDWA